MPPRKTLPIFYRPNLPKPTAMILAAGLVFRSLVATAAFGDRRAEFLSGRHILLRLGRAGGHAGRGVANWLDVNTDTMTYDVTGRRWYLTARLTW